MQLGVFILDKPVCSVTELGVFMLHILHTVSSGVFRSF